jgi:predicted alpha/beta superfamily hydrolase
MKLKIIFALIVFFESGLYSSLSAQDFNLYNTQKKIIVSNSVEDTFHIFISLPDSYDNSDKRYPVLYVLDGDIAFGIAASITRYLQIGENIPELIVVGIGYGALDKSAGEKRRRDYRPTAKGGAENFLVFLKDKLIPYIDSSYRTVEGDRSISGYSIGGLFALYTLFTYPETFNRYIVGSPYLVWDNSSIYNYEENSSEKIGEMKINLFISVGSEESEDKYFNPIDELVTKIEDRDYSNLKLVTKVFDGSGHLEGPPESLTHGLVSVFGKD